MKADQKGKDGSLKRYSGDGEKYVHSICIWKVNLTGLVYAMDLGDRRQGW